MKCQRCGREQDDNARYCNQCGASLEQNYRIPMNGPDEQPTPPPNYLWQAVAVTILCCLPFGIVGIIYASKVDSLFLASRYAEANNASRQAKTWTIVSLCTGLVGVLIYAVIVALGILSDTSLFDFLR